jgi:hypothetical protein
VGQAPSGKERGFLARSWAVGALLYLLAVMRTTVLPIPRLGVSSAIAGTANLPSGGLWVREPFRVLAAGFLYFTGLGVSELWDHRWIGTPRTAAPQWG